MVDRIERFNALCAEVAEKRKAKPDDDTVRYIAQLRLRREDLLARDLAGERVDVADLRWLSDALEKYAAAQEPIKVTLTVIGPDGVEREQRDGEGVTDFFQRQSREREAVQAAKAPPNDVPATLTEKNASATVSVAPKAAEKPYHETMQRDSRPDAPASTVGAAVWWSGANNRGSL